MITATVQANPNIAFVKYWGRVRRVHIIGAGPVGLLLTALLQSMEGLSVRLYEKRPAYTRTRMVKLASYLVADSLESYRVDHIDGESIAAIFEDVREMERGVVNLHSFRNTLRWNLDDGTEDAYNRSLVGFVPKDHVPMESIKLMMDWNKI